MEYIIVEKKVEFVYHIKLSSYTVAIDIWYHYYDELHQLLIIQARVLIKQMVINFCFTCDD